MKMSKAPILFLFFSVVGFLNATYLSVEHFMGNIPPCVVTSGCSTVLTSEWSIVLGIPIALLGALFYLLLMVLTIVFLKTKKSAYLLTASFITFLGITASICLMILQIFVIKSLCLYCTISAITSLILFMIALYIIIKNKDQKKQTSTKNLTETI